MFYSMLRVEKVVLGVVLFFLPIGKVVSMEESFNNIFNVSAIIEKSSVYKLQLKLENFSGRSLYFSSELLSRNEINMIVVVDQPFGEVLEEYAVLSNPLSSEIEVKQGDHYIRSINLEESYPSLIEKLNHNDLILYWSAKVNISRSDVTESFGGFLRLEDI